MYTNAALDFSNLVLTPFISPIRGYVKNVMNVQLQEEIFLKKRIPSMFQPLGSDVISCDGEEVSFLID